jgi:hypothetical protein
LVRQAGLSLRGAAAALAVFANVAGNSSPGPTPCATTLRSWILRLGYARLTGPLSHEVRWVWLIDHTLQIGATKLFVIVGVPLENVPFGVRPLQLADLHLVAMVPMDHSDGERVAEALETAVARTGVPRQIVADGGADLQNGIARFQTLHPETTSIPDVAHYAANQLKFFWEKDPRWQTFTRTMNETSAAIRQSRSAHLLAPKLRNKARFMSTGKFVRFGRILVRKLQATDPDPDLMRHYAWVSRYAEELSAWDEQQEIVHILLRQVRQEGLSARTKTLVEAEWQHGGVIVNPTTVALCHRLRTYLTRCGRGVAAGERLVGSTEVLESAFGVQKRLSGDQVHSGLTALSVGLGAMFGQATREQMREEVDRVPEKAVERWARQTFGPTVQWLRRKFFNATAPTTNMLPNPA